MNTTYKKLCVRLVTYPVYTKMHGQKNIKFQHEILELQVRSYSVLRSLCQYIKLPQDL